MIHSEHPFAICNYTRESEFNTAPSMTIPDLTLSVRDIYNRFRLGTLPAELVHDVLYDESDDFDSVLAEHIEHYDLVDADRELAKLRQKFELMRNKVSSERPQNANTSSQNEDAGESSNESEVSETEHK